MTILFFGLGSIARKHIKALKEISVDVRIVALRHSPESDKIEGVENIFTLEGAKLRPDFVVISTPTRQHENSINQALTFGCPIFIEKPVLSDLSNAGFLSEIIKSNKIATYIACNLRFHPCIRFLKDHLQTYQSKVNEVNVYCGSDLSKWRPETDYRKSYSAITEQGGGVHLDLIHEIDYCYWLFGHPLEVKGLRRKVSSLEIDSFDFANYSLIYEAYTVNVVLNYYRKSLRRDLELVTEDGTLLVDLASGFVKLEGKIIFEAVDFKMEQTYREQLEYFISHIRAGKKMMNDFEEAVNVLKIALT